MKTRNTHIHEVSKKRAAFVSHQDLRTSVEPAEHLKHSRRVPAAPSLTPAARQT